MTWCQAGPAVCMLSPRDEGFLMTEKTEPAKSPAANGSAKWNAPTGRRTDEWSEALVLIGDSQDRAAFTRFFRHFAPVI